MNRSSAADSRYDSFISFHGGQKLTDLGFSWAGPDDTVRDLAVEVYKRLCAFERGPSVFYDHAEIRGRFRDDLSNAVMQLRGGGVALILLSAQYLRRKYCLAELRAVLELEKLRNVDGRGSEAVVIRVVCLDADSSSVRSALRDPALKAIFGDLGQLQCHPLTHTSTCALVLQRICGHVVDYWGENRSLCLGKGMRVCTHYLLTFFETTPASLIAASFGIQGHRGMSVESIFGQALQKGKMSAYNLDALLEVNNDVNARAALLAFRRKWISDGWSWSIDSGENEICLTRFIDEAVGVLSLGQGANQEVAPASTSTSEAVDLADGQPPALQIGDVFRPHLPDRQHLSVGLEADAAVRLTHLKAAILPIVPSGASASAILSTSPDLNCPLRRVALTSINGEGGVGKTSTCKLLFAEEDVRKRFSDGAMIWIDVGQGATEEKVKDEIRRAVSKCGGKQSGKDIDLSASVSEAVEIASSYFSGRRILVVLDNVWETPAGFSVHSWAATLAGIATFPGSAVIVTTRFISVSRLSPGFDSIELGRYDLTTEGSQDWIPAGHLYDSLLKATLEVRSEDAYNKDRREVLEISCGLPIVISTFVGLVRRTRDGNVGNVLTKIRKSVSVLVGSSAGAKVSMMTCHPGLSAVMKECLAHLDEHHAHGAVFVTRLSSLNLPPENDSRLFRARYCHEPGKQFSSRYAALEIMSKSSTRLSFPVLRHSSV